MIRGARAFLARFDHLGLWLRFAVEAFVCLALAAGTMVVALGADPLQATAWGLLALAVGALARRTLLRAREARRESRSRRRARRALRPLRAEGWRVEEAVRWPGGGRLDFLALTADGALAFAIVAAPVRSERAAERAQEITSWLAIGAPPCVPVVAVDAFAEAECDDRAVLLVSLEALSRALAEAEAGFRRALRGAEPGVGA